MTLILLVFRRFATVWTRTGGSMSCGITIASFTRFKSMFRGSVFEQLVDEHKADRRGAPAHHQEPVPRAPVWPAFSGAVSLREIEAGLSSQQSRLYHVGGRSVARTTLAGGQCEPSLRRCIQACFAHIAASASRRTPSAYQGRRAHPRRHPHRALVAALGMGRHGQLPPGHQAACELRCAGANPSRGQCHRPEKPMTSPRPRPCRIEPGMTLCL